MAERSSSDRSRPLIHPQAQLPDPPTNRQSISTCSSNPNIFSDDYSLEPTDSEQTTLTPSNHSISSFTSSTTLRSVPTSNKHTSTLTSEHEPIENPFGDDARVSLDEDPYRSSLPPKGMDFVSRNSTSSASTAPSTAQRSQSNSSRSSVPPRALSPYTGATGPSHPYAMYPQVGVSRSSSVITTSTTRPGDRPSDDSNAPQHPYSMYPQSVAVEESTDDEAILPGFPGHSQEYRRPAGRADDDAGDLVGPDGHTEQLPPYTRYPDGATPNIERELEAVTDAEVAPEGNNHTCEEEEEEVQNEENSPRPLMTEPTSVGNNRPSEETPTGIMVFEEKLKAAGKRKPCCGLPVWTLALVCVVIFVVTCVGGVIGGVLGSRKVASNRDESRRPTIMPEPSIVTATVTPQMDVTPITAVPSLMSALPVGKYIIPASPKNQSKFCVADFDYKATWGCLNKGSIPIFVQSMDLLHGSISFLADPSPSTYTYGAQVPYLPAPTQPMALVYDTSEKNLGPAYFFKTSFDKLVVVPQDAFPTGTISRRRVPENEVVRRTSFSSVAATPGQSPWFCWWNGTVMELFLYVNKTTNLALYGPVIPPADTSASVSNAVPTGSPSYPRLIKIEERRDSPNAKPPYCQQMTVLQNGTVVTASLETLDIKEVKPKPTTTLKGPNTAPPQTYTAEAGYQSPCYCVSLTD